MRLHVEKHRVIMIHLMVEGNIGDDIDDSYAWKGGSNLLHTRHFSHFIYVYYVYCICITT